MSSSQAIANYASSLTSRVLDATDPSPQDAIDILSALRTETVKTDSCTMTIALLESTKIGKLLTKVVKTCKRHKRGSDEQSKWDEAISAAEQLLSTYKKAADEEALQMAKKQKAPAQKAASQPGLPATTSAYRQRLVSHSKELYKDPPAMPPPKIVIESKLVTVKPKRSKSGELTFAPGQDEALKEALMEFHPNRTPEEVLRAGSFGGTYFRPIVSSVTNIRYSAKEVLSDTVQPEWIKGVPANMLSSSTYNMQVNKFRSKCGGSLGMWESSGWISDADPYGWFQWYCRFYSGRRCSDDIRQIGRWKGLAGEKGRFRSQLCNKILAAGGFEKGKNISPVVRQTLLHWGLEITEEILSKHEKRKK